MDDVGGRGEDDPNSPDSDRDGATDVEPLPEGTRYAIAVPGTGALAATEEDADQAEREDKPARYRDVNSVNGTFADCLL